MPVVMLVVVTAVQKGVRLEIKTGEVLEPFCVFNPIGCGNSRDAVQFNFSKYCFDVQQQFGAIERMIETPRGKWFVN